MGDILEFPSQQTQGLAYLERELRDMLAARGADEPLIDFATGELSRIYKRICESEQYQFSIRLPDAVSSAERDMLQTQINTGLEGIRKENHSLTLELVAELLLAQVRLFQHERN